MSAQSHQENGSTKPEDGQAILTIEAHGAKISVPCPGITPKSFSRSISAAPPRLGMAASVVRAAELSVRQRDESIFSDGIEAREGARQSGPTRKPNGAKKPGDATKSQIKEGKPSENIDRAKRERQQDDAFVQCRNTNVGERNGLKPPTEKNRRKNRRNDTTSPKKPRKPDDAFLKHPFNVSADDLGKRQGVLPRRARLIRFGGEAPTDNVRPDATPQRDVTGLTPKHTANGHDFDIGVIPTLADSEAENDYGAMELRCSIGKESSQPSMAGVLIAEKQAVSSHKTTISPEISAESTCQQTSFPRVVPVTAARAQGYGYYCIEHLWDSIQSSQAETLAWAKRQIGLHGSLRGRSC